MSKKHIDAFVLRACSLLAWTTAARAQEVATPEDAMSKVWSAAKLLQEKGVSGLASLNSKDGPWVWTDSYVFAFDCRLDKMVVHPLRPDLVGRSILQITDNNGKAIFKELCRTANQLRGGWVEYVWTKPGAGRVSRKLSYTLTADMAFSTGIQVAAGVYDDKISVGDLDKLAEKLSDPTRYPGQ
jgi:signal transduction histidine kinase